MQRKCIAVKWSKGDFDLFQLHINLSYTKNVRFIRIKITEKLESLRQNRLSAIGLFGAKMWSNHEGNIDSVSEQRNRYLIYYWLISPNATRASGPRTPLKFRSCWVSPAVLF